jgi:thiosulfate dehydrogenase [quinone] large subunit
MLGLLGLGLALISGIGLRIAAVAGSLLMIMMWFSLLPLVNNPIVDEHIIYAVLFWLWPQLTATPQWWLRSGLSQKLSWLN